MKKYFKPVMKIVYYTNDTIKVSGGYDEDDGFYGEDYAFGEW